MKPSPIHRQIPDPQLKTDRKRREAGHDVSLFALAMQQSLASGQTAVQAPATGDAARAGDDAAMVAAGTAADSADAGAGAATAGLFVPHPGPAADAGAASSGVTNSGSAKIGSGNAGIQDAPVDPVPDSIGMANGPVGEAVASARSAQGAGVVPPAVGASMPAADNAPAQEAGPGQWESPAASTAVSATAEPVTGSGHAAGSGMPTGSGMSADSGTMAGESRANPDNGHSRTGQGRFERRSAAAGQSDFANLQADRPGGDYTDSEAGFPGTAVPSAAAIDAATGAINTAARVIDASAGTFKATAGAIDVAIGGSGAAEPAARLDASRLVAAWNLQSDSVGQTLTVRLTPDVFGAMSIRLERTDSGLAARIQSDSQAACSLLAAQRDQLEALLQAKGFHCRSIDIAWRSAGETLGFGVTATSGQNAVRHDQALAREQGFEPNAATGRGFAPGDGFSFTQDQSGSRQQNGRQTDANDGWLRVGPSTLPRARPDTPSTRRPADTVHRAIPGRLDWLA